VAPSRLNWLIPRYPYHAAGFPAAPVSLRSMCPEWLRTIMCPLRVRGERSLASSLTRADPTWKVAASH